MEDVIELMMKRVLIEPLATRETSRRDSQSEAFRVSFDYEDPDTHSAISRRDFACAAMLAAGALGGRRSAAAPSGGGPKLGLYSITYLGVWYAGEALTLEQVIQRAVNYGYQGVEIDGKRPHGNPLDMPKGRCQELRKLAAAQGIEIYAVAANNDFSSVTMSELSPHG